MLFIKCVCIALRTIGTIMWFAWIIPQFFFSWLLLFHFYIFVTNLHFICVSYLLFVHSAVIVCCNFYFKYSINFYYKFRKNLHFFLKYCIFFIYLISWIWRFISISFYIHSQYIKYPAKNNSPNIEQNSIKWSKSFLAQFIVAVHFVCFNWNFDAYWFHHRRLHFMNPLCKVHFFIVLFTVFVRFDSIWISYKDQLISTL